MKSPRNSRFYTQIVSSLIPLWGLLAGLTPLRANATDWSSYHTSEKTNLVPQAFAEKQSQLGIKILAHEPSFTGYEWRTERGIKSNFVALVIQYAVDRGYGFYAGPFQGCLVMAPANPIPGHPSVLRMDLFDMQQFNRFVALTKAAHLHEPSAPAVWECFDQVRFDSCCLLRHAQPEEFRARQAELNRRIGQAQTPQLGQSIARG